MAKCFHLSKTNKQLIKQKKREKTQTGLEQDKGKKTMSSFPCLVELPF